MTPKLITKRLICEAANEAVKDIESVYGKRYKLSFGGFGGSMMNQINMIAIIFFCQEHLEQEDIIRLLKDCNRIFVDKINSTEEVIPYLAKYPADSEITKVMIHFNHKKTFEKSDIVGSTLHKSTVNIHRWHDKAISISLE